MNAKTIAFVFGILLLLTGILGGGFEVKELKVPKVSLWPRILSLVIGLVFVVIAFPQDEGSSSSAGTQLSALDPAAQDTADIIIVRDLDADADNEQIQVRLIGGPSMDDLSVDNDNISDTTYATVKKAGAYDYTIKGSYQKKGEVHEYLGTGLIKIVDGQKYKVTFNGEQYFLE